MPIILPFPLTHTSSPPDPPHHAAQVFVESTQPVCDYYKGLGKLVSVDGSNAPEDVYGATKPHFDRFKQ